MHKKDAAVVQQQQVEKEDLELQLLANAFKLPPYLVKGLERMHSDIFFDDFKIIGDNDRNENSCLSEFTASMNNDSDNPRNSIYMTMSMNGMADCFSLATIMSSWLQHEHHQQQQTKKENNNRNLVPKLFALY